jgi:hypothetical protein
MSGSELFVGVFELINHFLFEIVDARIEPRNVLLRRHVLNDLRKHLTNFLERRLLRRYHMRQVYHNAPNE